MHPLVLGVDVIDFEEDHTSRDLLADDLSLALADDLSLALAVGLGEQELGPGFGWAYNDPSLESGRRWWWTANLR